MISWQSSPLNLEALEAPRNHWPQNRNIGWPKLLLVSASNWGTRFALRPCKMVCWGPKKQNLNASLSASVWTHNMPVAFSRMDRRWLQKSMMVSWIGCNKSLNRQPAQIQKTEPCQSNWAQAAKPKGPWRWTAPKSSLAKKAVQALDSPRIRIWWNFLNSNMAVCQNLVPLVNLKIAGKWMFIPLDP